MSTEIMPTSQQPFRESLQATIKRLSGDASRAVYHLDVAHMSKAPENRRRALMDAGEVLDECRQRVEMLLKVEGV